MSKDKRTVKVMVEEKTKESSNLERAERRRKEAEYRRIEQEVRNLLSEIR